MLRNIPMSSRSSSVSEDASPGSHSDFLGFVRRVLFVVAVVGVFWSFHLAAQAVLMALTALILAVVLGALADHFSRLLPLPRRIAYKLSLLIIFLAAIGIITTMVMLTGPQISSDLRALAADFPQAVEHLKHYPVVNEFLQANPQEQRGAIGDLFARFSSFLMNLASSAATVATSAILIVTVALFLATEPRLYRGAIVSIFPLSMRSRASEVMEACAQGVWRWLIGQGFAMLIIGVFTIAGYYLIGLKYALTLGLMAGLLQFIPYIGVMLAAIPALLVGLTMSPGQMLSVFLVYSAIQATEGNLITPIVLKKQVHLPPAFTLMGTLAFGYIFGPLGLIVATPTMVMFYVLYQELYQRDILGLQVSSPGDKTA